MVNYPSEKFWLWESGVSPSGEGVCFIFLDVQPAFFLARNHARNGVGIVVAFKTCFQVFHTVSEEQRYQEQERAREKKLRNLRNLNEESL